MGKVYSVKSISGLLCIEYFPFSLLLANLSFIINTLVSFKHFVFEHKTSSTRQQQHKIEREKTSIYLWSMDEVFLPQSVHNLLRQICIEKNQPWPDADVRRELASLSEEKALEVLHSIYNNSQYIRTLNGFIKFMIRKCSSPSPSRIVPTSYFQEQPFSCQRASASSITPLQLDFERFQGHIFFTCLASCISLLCDQFNGV